MTSSKDIPGFENPAGSVSPVMDRAFILLRFTLIIATSYLLLAEFGPRSVPHALTALMAVVLLSNIGALAVPTKWLQSPLLIAIAILGDTTWITIALIATGRFTAEFFYLYFFVLFLAGIGENIRLIALSVTVVCAAYIVLIAKTLGPDEVLTTQTLIRVPFLFSVAIFYGYLVDRLRSERHRSSSEQAIIEGLERNRRALAEANEELRRLSDVKSNFVSIVSHELKSPLTAIKNAAALIDPGAEGKANEKFLQMIRRNADRLNTIISDLLDMSKVESGTLTIAADPVDLRSFLSEVVEPFEAEARTAGVTFDLNLPETLPEVLADADRIEQVVSNLLSNALKATPKGGSIAVGVEYVDGSRATITITDDGTGLTAEDQSKVFEPFFQAGNVLDGRPAGTGLGLTICRDLVRGHGSELHIESEIGAGSRFSFSLPIRSQRSVETIAFENQVRTTFRAHPYFTVIVADCAGGASNGHEGATSRTLDTVHERLDKLLPRALDVLCDQPSLGRIVVVLLSTPLDGGWVVKRKLASAFASKSVRFEGRGIESPKILGPAGYPEDGEYGSGLIERAILVGERMEDEV
ncbi:MAG: sensor histidine kinase [Thermoanaerobaculales bacterium]